MQVKVVINKPFVVRGTFLCETYLQVYTRKKGSAKQKEEVFTNYIHEMPLGYELKDNV